ncbi:hypothetical protein Moror_15083 [Moniliophthora roreri MCA 2997]|uniref:Secreted protein n=1 Tax=Moniliophthora roreri (strain MCA 2997) TaxID=1381753 RepID=V2XV34_MONRO|nr:hypothetical protein Moror_15083 [Moniliophthora roreri MCA 2997]
MFKSKALFALALALSNVGQVVQAKNTNQVIKNKLGCNDIQCVTHADYKVTGADHKYRHEFWYDDQEHIWRHKDGEDCYINAQGWIHRGCDAAYLWIEYKDKRIVKVDSFDPPNCCLADFYYENIKKVSGRPT